MKVIVTLEQRFNQTPDGAVWTQAGFAYPFWRRYLGKYDWFPQIFRTHPSLSARERITREAIAALSGPPPKPLP